MAFYPPLGSHTYLSIASHSTIYFTYTPSDPVESRQPEVWTSLPSGEWNAVPLVASPSGLWSASVTLAPLRESLAEATFEFTYRFKKEDSSFEWLGVDGSNGRLYVSAAAPLRPTSNFVRVESFSLPEEGSSGDTVDFPLADLVSALKLDFVTAEGMVLERSRRWWFLPRLISSDVFASLSDVYPTQFLLLRLPAPQSRLVVLFPFCSATVSSSLYKSHDGSFVLRCTRDSSKASGKEVVGHLAVGMGDEGDLQALVNRCVALAAETLSPNSSPVSTVKVPKRGITWCTWNALGPTYTLSQVLTSLDQLRADGGVGRAIDAVLLDDGWQDTKIWDGPSAFGRGALWSYGTRQGWFDVGTTPVGEELKEAVRMIKEKGVAKVGVWLTIAGYWDGIHVDSPIGDALPLTNFRLASPAHPDADTNWHFPASTPDIQQFYKTYFSVLEAAGVDFVKVDDQADADYFPASVPPDVGELRTAMFSLSRHAAHTAFGEGNVIHCMAGSPRLWGGALALLPSPSGTPDVIRNFDDYLPNDDDSHRFHVAFNGQIAVLSRAFPGLLADFDMCDERPPWGPFHVAARAFQAAPVLSTDSGGMTKQDGAWDRLVSQTEDGLKVLKPGATGAVIEGRLNEDVFGGGVGPALKMGVEVIGASGAVLGWWNCRQGGAPSTDVLDARDVVEALGVARDVDKNYVVVLDSREVLQITKEELESAKGAPRAVAKPIGRVQLAPKSAVVACVAPVFALPGGGGVACVGLLHKYAGLSAITSISLTDRFGAPPSANASDTAIVKPFQSRHSSGALKGAFSGFFRRPIATSWSELSALFRWVLGSAFVAFLYGRGRNTPTRSAITAETLVDNESQGSVLRLQLGFMGCLGIAVIDRDAADLEIRVEGKALDAGFIQQVKGVENLVELDLASFVESDGTKGNWLVEVRLPRKP